MKREIKTHKVEGQDHGEFIDIIAVDERGPGNANHQYQIVISDHYGHTKDEELLADINFQKGPVREDEVGVNGISNETLIAIVIDRLQGFQSGEFSCRENAIVLTHLETAMLWLHKRTRDRLERGVEGRNLK